MTNKQYGALVLVAGCALIPALIGWPCLFGYVGGVFAAITATVVSND